ncbi:fatty acid synthase-like [Chironomus tepperi]|uniref:fatty acid synthase-like n=1 Tax=Chironomus tepperi TaxID=113505 RepID=UPI00391F0A8B
MSSNPINNTVVISGMSGRFPKSRTIAEFQHNIYNKIDMTSPCSPHWSVLEQDIPDRYGKTVDIDKFDMEFFPVPREYKNLMDPQMRMVLEHAYEAILDAGISPLTLRGSNTGVFIGCCFVDAHSIAVLDRAGKELAGSLRCLNANYISYLFDFKGPSYVVDTACSSSGYAADLALKSIQNGECDQAIVAGVNTVLLPTILKGFMKINVISKDGYARSFDEEASGYSRAEAIVALFFQKSKDAKRIYAKVIHGRKNTDGFKKEGLASPSRYMQINLLEGFYKEIGINPNLVDYVEAHSTGTKAGDTEECASLDAVFCSNRTKPLLIGTVKSNMGHSEGASTACSIVKSLLAFETKKIAPNMHLKNIRTGIESLVEGRMKAIDEIHDFDGSLIGVNGFGFGGSNVHLLLESHKKEKVNEGVPADDLPRMVLWSGRTEEAVNAIFENLENTQFDAEYIALLQNTQVVTAVLNTYRGYGIYIWDTVESTMKCLSKNILKNIESKRPVVWVYTGMGAQWPQMLSDLQKIPLFTASINKCHEVLAKKDINLIEILTSGNEKMMENVVHAYVGIAAIQIGLTDVLRALDISPDFIIGHSVGELGCAYADGCNSAEEIILAAYSRGMASLETEIIHGSMAAVGLGHEELKEILIDGIEIACHNSSNSSTISGPSELVAAFIEQLKEKKIFVKEVNSSNIPYHTSYISQMAPKLLARLKDIIKNPKERSSKWLSSSVPKDLWNQEQEQHTNLSSPEYHTNNLLNPVLFQEVLDMLPKDALTIEIAPSGLLQAILRRALPDGAHISLTKKGDKENSINLMTSLGKIFQNGVDMDISKLYPPVEFPVSRGTPMISPLIKWDHSISYDEFRFENVEVNELKLVINLRDPSFEYLTGHKIDGSIVFPGSGYLVLAYRIAAAHYKKGIEEFDAEYENVKFINACFLSMDKTTTLTINYQSGDGRFEVREEKLLLCVGYIRPTVAEVTPLAKPNNDLVPTMSHDDFYKELRIRGYNYEKSFKSVMSAKIDGSELNMRYNNNLVEFLDAVAQNVIIRRDLRTPFVPSSIRRIVLKPSEIAKSLRNVSNDQGDAFVTSYYSKELDLIRCDGLEVRNAGYLPIPKKTQSGRLSLLNYKFLPNYLAPVMSRHDALSVSLRSFLELNNMINIKIVEIDSGDEDPIMDESFLTFSDNAPVTGIKLLYFTDSEVVERISGIEYRMLTEFDSISQIHIIFKGNCIHDCQFLDKMKDRLADGGYLICREPKSIEAHPNIPSNLKFIAKIQLEDENFIILKFMSKPYQIPSAAIKITSTDFSWLDKVKETIKTEPTILYSEGENESGILGLVNCIRREPAGKDVKCVFIDDPTAPKFDFENEFYRKQLEKGMAMNVYRNGQWGSYYHLDLKPQLLPKITPETRIIADIQTRGDFSSIKWSEGPHKYTNEDELITVHYAALNFKDIMLASGRVPVTMLGESRLDHQHILGCEFAGVTSSGEKVIGLIISGGLATHVKKSHALLLDLPKGWTLEEGATILCTYGTVFLGLLVRSQMKKGNSILIHAGSGGVGLAAIHTAMSLEMEVFTTVSTEEKRNYLLELFPKLKPENIGNSRDTSFEDMIMRNTNGKGVDFVLNSLSDDKLLASLRCVGQGGTFVEIGKSDIYRDNKINLGQFVKDISFLSVNADILAYQAKMTQKKPELLFELMEDAIEKGIIKPLKATIFNADQLEEAFRYMASGKHIGKILIKILDENGPLIKEVTPRVFFNPQHSYIICGGLGGFGMELADWMIIRGCRKIVLSSSRGVVDGYHEYKFRYWRSYGADIKTSTANITTASGCHQLIAEASELGPVGGIFNLAVKLVDAILENQTVETFEQCMAPKGTATKFLDEISREKCKELEYFVVFSSIACGFGNIGQTNYGMANSVMERIIENRRRDNLPGQAIQWGPIGDVGLYMKSLTERQIQSNMEISTTLMQSIYSCLQVMDSLITSNEPIVTSLVIAEKAASSKGRNLLLQQVIRALGIKDINAYPKDTKIIDLGMDSILTVEIIQLIEKHFNVQLTVNDIRTMTLAQLIDIAGTDDKAAE